MILFWVFVIFGIAVVGMFVGKDLKNLISNIDKLSVDDIVNNPIVSDVVEKVENYTEEQIEN